MSGHASPVRGASPRAVSEAGPDEARSPRAERLWARVDEIVALNRTNVDGLVFHGLGLLAADLLGPEAAQTLPRLQALRDRMSVVAMTVPYVLERACDAADESLLIVKGPEVARRYPHDARSYGDIDLLTRDARRTQRNLVAAGFVEREDPRGVWDGIHHLPPVRLPGTLLDVEVHSEPKWLEGLPPPSVEELYDGAVASEVGVDGLLAPAPAHHALLLAAHAWSHKPLGRMRDLVDVGAFELEASPAVLDATADRWGVDRMWHTFRDAIGALVTGGSTLPLRLWAGHVGALRDQTVLEAHLERVLSPIWGYPRSRAPGLVGSALANEIRPAFDEDWGGKARRTAAALRRPFVSLDDHRRMLGDAARRGERPGGKNRRADDDV